MKLKNRILATVLIAALVVPLISSLLPTEVQAKDEYGFSMSKPDDFDAKDGKNPYGVGYTALNPISELFIMRSGKKYFDASYWNDMKTQEGITKGTRTSLENKTSESTVKYVSSKAFDPDGKGHDYMVAQTGLEGKETVVWTYNTKTGKKGTVVKISMGSGHNSDWFGSIDQWEHTGFFTLTAGDFDGDGADELAVYVPYRGNPHVIIYECNSSGTLVKKNTIKYTAFMDYADISNKFENNGKTARAMVQASMDAADIDRDGKEELILMGSFADLHDDSDTKPITDRSSTLAVYQFDNDVTKTPTRLAKERIKDTTTSIYVRSASCAAGDIDYDGFEEIVVAGYYTTSGKSDSLKDDKFAMTALDYDPNTGKLSQGVIQTEEMNGFVKGGLRTGDTIQAPPALVCAAVNGRNEKDRVFLEGNLYSYDKNFTKDRTTTQCEKYTYDWDRLPVQESWVESAIAGNFDGNDLGIEQIVYTTGYETQMKKYHGYNLNITGKHQVQKTSNNQKYAAASDAYTDKAEVQTSLAGTDYTFVSLAAVDADNDTDTMTYSKKEYTYTNVDVLALLQSAPYFKDLEDNYYDALGSTAFGMTEGGGTSTTTTKSVSAGAYVSVEAGVPGVFEFTSEATYTHDWEWEYEKESSIEYSVSFEGGTGENSVVLYRTPVTLYYYTVYPANGAKSYSMSIGIQDNPVYSVMDVDVFNEIAKKDSELKDKVITDDIIKAVPGQPQTYPSNPKDLENFTGYTSTSSCKSSVTKSFTTQSITVGSQNSESQSYNNSFELKVGINVGAVGGGAIAGGEWGNGITRFSYKNVDKGGTVASPPATEYSYGFEWRFGTWTADVGGTKVPVLGYIVNDVYSPPSLPEDIAVDTVTQNSITLGWSQGVVPALNYEIYQYFDDSVGDDGYSLLATISGTEDSFTCDDLEPGNAYQFAIRAVGKDKKTGERIASEYSNLVTGVTLKEGSAPIIHSISDDQNVCTGDSAFFTVDATPSEGVTKGVTYSWQVRPSGSNIWSTVPDGNKATLTLKNVTDDMDGNRYRCIVSEIKSGARAYTYSDTRALNVSRADSSIEVKALSAAGTNQGMADSVKATPVITPIVSIKELTVAIGDSSDTYYEYKNTVEGGEPGSIYRSTSDNEYYVLTGFDEETGTASGRILLSQEEPYFAQDADGNTPIEDLKPDEMHGPQSVYEYEVYDDSDVLQSTVIYNKCIASKKDGTIINVYEKDGIYYTLNNDELSKVGDDEIYAYTIQPVYDTEPGIESKDFLNEETEYDVWYIGENKIYQKDNDYYLVRPDVPEIVQWVYLITPNELTGKGTEGNIEYRAIPATDPVTVENQLQSFSYENVDGEEVTLTATVTSKSTGKVVDGVVTFKIVNNQTGEITTLSQNVKGKDTGTAKATWTPIKAGHYTITATYSGNNYLNVSLGSTDYYAYDASESAYTGYILEGDDITYGETIQLTLKKAENQDDNNIKEEDLSEGVSVEYSVIYTDENGIDKTEQFTESTFSPELAGNYIFSAKITSEGEQPVTVQKLIKVLKRPIIITAPSRSNISSTESEKVPDMEYAKVEYSEAESQPAILDKDKEEYDGLTALLNTMLNISSSPELTKDSGANTYITRLNWKTKTDSSEYIDEVKKFRQKYEATLKSGVYNVIQGIYKATYKAGSNGTICAYQGDNSVSFESGDYIVEDSRLAFTAIPDKDFQVKAWSIKDADGKELEKDKDYKIVDNRLILEKINKNIYVEVTFEPSYYNLRFSSKENGILKALYLTDGNETEISSPDKVPAGKGIRFVAEPSNGYVVDKWLVTENNGTQTIWKNEDGSAYSENILDFERLNGDLAVVVEFAKEEFYDVETQVTAADDKMATGASITVDGLIDGKARKGSTLTFNAKILDNQIVQEWRVYDSEGNFKVVSGNADSYVLHNIQENVKVELLVNVFTQHKLYFKAVNVDNENETVNNVITAKWNETILESGKEYSAYIPIAFTASVPENMQMKEWTVRSGAGSSEESTGERNESYTLGSLNKDTWVTLQLEQKPQLTYSAPEGQGTINCTETPSKGYLDKYQEKAELVLSPEFGYEVDVDKTTVTGASSEFSDAADSDDRILTLKPEDPDKGYTKDIEIQAFFKEIPHVATVEYSVKKLGTVSHGTLAAQIERKGIEDYKQSFNEVESGILSELYRDSNVILKVNPDEGYEVQKWTVNGEEVTEGLSTEALKNDVLTLSVDGSTEYTVQVQLVEAGNKLTFGAKDDEGGTVTAFNNRTKKPFNSGNTLSAGTSITFTANVNAGYELKGWEVNGETVEGETETTFTMEMLKDTDTKVEAVFEKILDKTTSTVTFGSNDTTMGTVTAMATEKDGTSHKIVSGDTVKNESSVQYTATPVDGYMVEGWYLDAECTNLIEDTAEKTEYKQDSVQDDTIIYVKFVELPVYKITVQTNGTGKGSLSAQVGDKSVPIENGMIEAPYHSKVTITAVPFDEYSYVSGWNGEENTSDSYVIQDVTKDTTVTATFSTVELVDIFFQVDEEDIEKASLETGYASEDKWEIDNINETRRMIKGKSARFKVTPLEDKMVDTWIVTYHDGTVISGSQLGLENELLLKDVEKGVKVEVQLKDVEAYDVPLSVNGYTIQDMKLMPDTLADKYEGQVREGGNITFTLIPDKDKGIINITDANGSDKSNIVNAKKNSDGSYTVTISNIQKEMDLQVETFDYYQVTIPKTTHGSVKAVITGKYTDTITLKDGKSVSVPEGSTIKLDATPDTHYVFGKWTYKSEYKPEINANQKNIVIEDLADNLDISASFEWENWYYTLKYTQPGHGTIQVKDEKGKTVNSGEKVLENTKLTFTVTPENCYEFTGWGGSLSGVNATLTTAIKKDMAVTANIKAVAHTYGEPTFTWNATSSATATFTCTKCGKTTTVNCTITSQIGTEEITYTAKAVLDGKTWTNQKTAPETHTFGEPVFTWNGTSAATATFTCSRCGKTTTVKCTITSKKGSDKITYTAKVIFNGKTWTETKSDDITISNTDFRLQGSVASNKVKLTWTRVPGAKGYDIWYGKCGSRSMRLMKSVKNNSKRTLTFKKKGSTNYKYYVKAYKMVNGKKKYLNKSNIIHLAQSRKYTNVKKVKAVSKLSLKKGKQKKLSVKLTYQKKGKQLVKHMRNLSYTTSNKKVVSVTKKGVVKARAKGSCYIYVTAYSGAYAKVKVTVK